MNKISTSGSYDGECYTINVAFNDFHVMTLDGLSREDLFELASCITAMMHQDDFNKLTMENKVMPMSEKVEEHLKEAEASLRAALAFAARTEKPMVTSTIADAISRIDSLIRTHQMLDSFETMMDGKSGFGKFFQ